MKMKVRFWVNGTKYAYTESIEILIPSKSYPRCTIAPAVDYWSRTKVEFQCYTGGDHSGQDMILAINGKILERSTPFYATTFYAYAYVTEGDVLTCKDHSGDYNCSVGPIKILQKCPGNLLHSPGSIPKAVEREKFDIKPYITPFIGAMAGAFILIIIFMKVRQLRNKNKPATLLQSSGTHRPTNEMSRSQNNTYIFESSFVQLPPELPSDLVTLPQEEPLAAGERPPRPLQLPPLPIEKPTSADTLYMEPQMYYATSNPLQTDSENIYETTLTRRVENTNYYL